MDTILDKLKEYFQNTSQEKVIRDWKRTEHYDQIDSPSVETFILESKQLFEVGS